MLILARKKDRRIVIGDSIEIVVVEVGNGWARLGIEAPKNIPVYRKELVEEVVSENIRAANSATAQDPETATGAVVVKECARGRAEPASPPGTIKKKGE
ncbi:MAG: carbon storage regulator [Armatimonadota bacterium]